MKQEYECPLCRMGKFRAPSSSEIKRHVWFEHGKEEFERLFDQDTVFFTNEYGTIKPAEPNDNPDDIMAAGMPRLSSMPGMQRLNVGAEVPCPMCGDLCSARPHLLREARKIYPGRVIALCTVCAAYGNLNKGTTPAWIQERSVSPDQLLQMVIDQAEGPPLNLAEVIRRKNSGIYWHEPTRTFRLFDEGVEQAVVTEQGAERYPDKQWQRKFEHAKKWAVLRG